MVAIPAPGEAAWLPGGEAPHDEANMGLDAKRPDSGLSPRSSPGIPERHRRAGVGFSSNDAALLKMVYPHPSPPVYSWLLLLIVGQFSN
jgi:hypothetical protein